MNQAVPSCTDILSQKCPKERSKNQIKGTTNASWQKVKFWYTLAATFLIFFFFGFHGFIPLTTFPLLLHFPWKHLAPVLPPLTEPIAVTLSSLGPGPLGASPDCCLPGTYFLCPIPPSSHPKVPPPAGIGATLRTLTTKLGFVLACTADSCWYFWVLMNLVMLKIKLRTGSSGLCLQKHFFVL